MVVFYLTILLPIGESDGCAELWGYRSIDQESSLSSQCLPLSFLIPHFQYHKILAPLL